MKTWFLERWNDPAKFTATLRAAIAGLGSLFALDVIPTGIPGAGPKIAAILQAIALAMAAGDKNAANKPRGV